MNNVFDLVEKEIKNDERPILTGLEKEANVFVKKMMQAKATKVIVNKDYFEPILNTFRPDLKCENGVRIGSVEIEIGSCKKYYFVR